MRCQALTVLRDERLRKESMVKVIFDTFRQNKEDEKYSKTLYQLTQVEIPLKIVA
jgi:hypothetical protein